jgi:hypothetical protein
MRTLRKSWDEVDDETKQALLQAVQKFSRTKVSDPDDAMDMIEQRIDVMHAKACWLKSQAELLFPGASIIEFLEKGKFVIN